MQGHHFDAHFVPCLDERIGVVGAVTNEALGHLRYETGVEGGGGESHLMRHRCGGISGERKAKTVCHCHELRTFALLGRSHSAAPL